MIAKNNLAQYQARLDYLDAQQRLSERHLQIDNPLNPEDVTDIETIITCTLSENGYKLNELEKLRLDRGRIYGKANVTSIKTDDGRHHTAAIDFHTDYGYSVVFDNHKIGGDEWITPSNEVIYKLTYDDGKQKLYLNNAAIYSVKAANTRVVLRALFEQPGTVKEVTKIKDMYGVPHSDKNYAINTKSIAGNIKNKSGLKDYGLGFMMSSFDYDWGLRIITQITEDDIVKNNLDKEAIDTWLETKTGL